MAGVKGRSGRRCKVSQTVIEAMGKYRDNLDKLSDELYFMARNTNLTASVRLQAINLFLEKCVPKFDYKPPEMILTFTADIVRLGAEYLDEVLNREKRFLEEGENYNPGG